MIVILINESEGKAWLRTRRILSKYLPQIGSRTWAGHISAEGLDDLHSGIKKVASKAGSVSCHRVTGRNSLELQWIAGNRKQFDEVGRFSFRTETSKPTFDTPLAPRRRLLHQIVQLAALLHDVGKATVAFQSKLQGKYFAEHFRHDLMGFFMLREKTSQFQSDQAWLTALSQTPEAVFDWTREKTLPVGDTISMNGPLVRGYCNEKPLLFTLLWLVLTHHRLPQGKVDIQFNTHTNENLGETKSIAPASECLQIFEGVMPWQEAGWLGAVSSSAKQILALIKQDDSFDSELNLHTSSWLLLVAHWARPCLIYSDHLASIAKQESGEIAMAQKAFPLANTIAIDATHRVGGDALHVHLIKTKRFARRVLLVAATPAELFRNASIPSSSNIFINNNDARYAWQHQLAFTIQEATHAVRPTFVGIIAGTGCGKTIAGVRAMHSLSGGNMRYTLALGLRSLTLQSANAMIRDAGFSKSDVAVAIGQPQASQWQEKVNTGSESRNAFMSGSESSDGADNYFELTLLDGNAPAAIDLENLPAWIRALDLSTKEGEASSAALLFSGAKHRAMIDTPILACTADHLVAAVEMRTGGSARMALRMMTSDLLLDEIDAYSAQDLQSIGKLAMLTGMAGRSVVVMSATANDIVIAGIYNAWAAGINAKKLIDGPQTDLGVVILADQVNPPIVLQEHSVGLVKEAHQQLVASMVRTDADVKQRLAILELSSLIGTSQKEELIRDEIFGLVYAECVRIHELNCSIDPITGIRMSIGFVRMNHAKNAWHLAKYLLERNELEDEPEVRTLSYHAKHPRAAIGIMDATLNNLMNRKNADAIWKQEEIRTALSRAKEKKRTDLIVIVATTTLQETGRDHDYDWAILEPRSVRGEVQASGRVRRHRPAPWPHVNIALMSHPIRTIIGNNTAPHWGLPGVEEPRHARVFGIDTTMESRKKLTNACGEIGISFESSDSPPENTRGRPPPKPTRSPETSSLLSAISALPVTYWQENGVSAVAALDATGISSKSLIGQLEALSQHLHLLSERESSNLTNNETNSLSQYLRRQSGIHCALTSQHALKTRFRQSQNSVELITLPTETGGWNFRWIDDTGRTQTFQQVNQLSTNQLHLDRMLINLQALLQTALHKGMKSEPKLGTLSWQLAAVQINQYGDSVPTLVFDANLGFLVGSHQY